jgi:hypothetical protein
MMAWLSLVRVADMDAIRWALTAFGDTEVLVSSRRAQQWAARMLKVGLVGKSRPTFRDGSILWVVPQRSGERPPNVYRQTTRHEVAVASVSARYLAAGFSWELDRRPHGSMDHQADGVATRSGGRVLVEVELTQKTRHRYQQIFTNHVFRLEREGVTQVVYFGTGEVTRAVAREADRLVFRTSRDRVLTLPVFDVRGRWVGRPLEVELPTQVAVPSLLEGAGVSW